MQVFCMHVHAFEIKHTCVLQIDTCLSHLVLYKQLQIMHNPEELFALKLAHTLFDCFPYNVF